MPTSGLSEPRVALSDRENEMINVRLFRDKEQAQNAADEATAEARKDEPWDGAFEASVEEATVE
jgi:hypothetical protein